MNNLKAFTVAIVAASPLVLGSSAVSSAESYIISTSPIVVAQHSPTTSRSGFPQAAHVRSVQYHGGAFVQSGHGTWIEGNADNTFRFAETGRDQWSIYLKSVDRQDVRIQIDLWTEQIKYNGNFLYRIVGAQ